MFQSDYDDSRTSGGGTVKKQCSLLAVCSAALAVMLVGLIPAGAQSRLPACPKDPKLRYHNCFGSYTSPRGNKYVGEFQDNKYNGRGTLTLPSGQKYVGEFKDNNYNGQGTYTWPSGQKYVGAFKDDKYNGQVTLISEDGRLYVGEFKDDNREGQGTQTWPSGQKYVGEFKDNNMTGHGTYTWPSGQKYVGPFKDGKSEGWGTFTWPDGRKYVGEFKNDKSNGQGTLTLADGAKYIGEFKDDRYHGTGTLYAPDGSVAQAGLWENDKFVRAATAPNPSEQIQQAIIQSSSPSAITTPPLGRRVALIIGNAGYQYSPLLMNPTRDAPLLAATLRNAGFESVLVKTDLTREATVQALREFSAVADTADWAVVYYSGHGIEFGGANYIIPVDARLKADRDIDLEAVNVGQVMNVIEGAKRLRVIILDACRDNPFASQMRRTMATRSLGRGLARVEPEAGTLVVYAAKHGEVALDGTGANSPFVEALVSRINQRPGLEIRRLFDFVRDDVLASTGRKQQPFSYGSLSASEDFYFAK